MSHSALVILLGNSLTKYDQALFALLAPILAASLFSKSDSLMALMLTYSILAIDWIARPLGAFCFGWIGDKKGRQQALYYSLMGIALTMLIMSSAPLLSGPDRLSPLVVFLIRLLQNFCAAGETTNGAILILEQTPPSRRNWMSSLYDSSGTSGWLFASVLVALFGRLGDLSIQWPWLFRIGSLIALYGLLLRFNRIQEVVSQRSTTMTLSWYINLKQYWKVLLALMAASGFSYATYTFSFILIQGYMPLVSSLTHQNLLEVNIVLILLDIMLLPVFGYLATQWGHRHQMLGAALSMCMSTPFIFYLMQQATFPSLLFCRIWIVLLGVAFSATYHAWVQTLLPHEARSRIASLGYTLGSRIIGLPTSVIALWLFQKTGLIGTPIFYLGITAGLAAIAIYKTKPLTV